MIYDIVHRTTYEYAEPVTVSHHAARMMPKVLSHQTRETHALKIEPEPILRKLRSDYFGNRICFFSIQEVHEKLEVIATSRVSVKAAAPPEPARSPPWEEVAALFMDPVSPEVIEPYQFVFDSPLLRASPELADYARGSFPAKTPLLAGALDLNRRIHRDFQYDPAATSVATPLEEILGSRRGVCQDVAHVAVASLRSLGLPACYVSGYIRTRPLGGEKRLVGADASHAWFSVYCPGAGWVDFDPTNDVMPATDHITVAHGRDFGDVSPLAGIITGGGRHEVSVAVDVIPIRTD